MGQDFSVDITAAPTVSGSLAQAFGSTSHTITDQEVSAFGLTSSNMRQSFAKVMGSGSYLPDYVWLRAPTPPEGNKYNDFHWDEVSTTLEAVDAQVIGVNSKPVIAHHVTWTNNLDHSVHYHADMSISKTVSTSQSWSQSQSVSVNQKITYGIKFADIGGSIGGETGFTYTNNWGETQGQEQSVTVGVSEGADDDVPAHSAETAYLFANLGSLTARVTYRATLTGTVCGCYEHQYNGHWFWGIDPNALLDNAGLATSVLITQDVNVDFYSDANVEVDPGPFDPNKQPSQKTTMHFSRVRPGAGEPKSAVAAAGAGSTAR
ncbi:hypothetical protein ACWEKR_24595 [Nocardia sp. NPDC004573]